MRSYYTIVNTWGDLLTEKQLENKVKRFFKKYDIWFTKIWGGGFQRAGIPDLLACVNGRFVAVELKSSTGRPTELQKWNIEKIQESGGIGLVLYPDQFEEFKKMIEEELGKCHSGKAKP